MKTIEEFASVHLGKAGDGTVVKPYVTPTEIDNTLLVVIPRLLNRTQYNIDENNLPFVGFDIWNCYEVSYLLNNGYPVNCVAKIVYPSNSKFIVESKSLKLYLNSFNMHKFHYTKVKSYDVVSDIIQTHLSTVLNTKVEVSLFSTQNAQQPIISNFINIDSELDVDKIQFNSYNENPNILKTNENNKVLSIRSSSLRSNCRVTNQPDFGDVYVYMTGKKIPTDESLLQYIISMRNENHFHEEICECIFKRLSDLFEPEKLLVACLYTRRGGIDINPVRASDKKLIKLYAQNMIQKNILIQKTLRQ